MARLCLEREVDRDLGPLLAAQRARSPASATTSTDSRANCSTSRRPSPPPDAPADDERNDPCPARRSASCSCAPVTAPEPDRRSSPRSPGRSGLRGPLGRDRAQGREPVHGRGVLADAGIDWSGARASRSTSSPVSPSTTSSRSAIARGRRARLSRVGEHAALGPRRSGRSARKPPISAATHTVAPAMSSSSG